MTNRPLRRSPTRKCLMLQLGWYCPRPTASARRKPINRSGWTTHHCSTPVKKMARRVMNKTSRMWTRPSSSTIRLSRSRADRLLLRWQQKRRCLTLATINSGPCPVSIPASVQSHSVQATPLYPVVLASAAACQLIQDACSASSRAGMHGSRRLVNSVPVSASARIPKPCLRWPAAW